MVMGRVTETPLYVAVRVLTGCSVALKFPFSLIVPTFGEQERV